jgi:hypothetical protein
MRIKSKWRRLYGLQELKGVQVGLKVGSQIKFLLMFQIFGRIQKQTKSVEQSGWNENQGDVMDFFHIKYLKPFKFSHCFDILKQMPKFNPFEEDRDRSETKQIVNEIGSIMGDSLSRPIGTKKAKVQNAPRSFSTHLSSPQNSQTSSSLWSLFPISSSSSSSSSFFLLLLLLQLQFLSSFLPLFHSYMHHILPHV